MRAVEQGVGSDKGVKALVAVEGFWDPEWPCRAGELLVARVWCGRVGCSCGAEFRGVASHGDASVGRVVRLRDVPRAQLERQLAVTLRRHEDGEQPQSVAAALLDEVETIEEGRLVRREDDVLLPFPIAARIEGAGTIVFHMEDPP